MTRPAILRASPARSALLGSLLATAVLCLPYPLMYLYRGVYKTHYPEAFAAWQLQGSFAVLGTAGMETNDEVSYAARTQAAATRGLPVDPFVKDSHSRRIVVMDFATYFLMGLVQRLTANITLTWILLRFACCAAWFLLVFTMVNKATRSVQWALAGAAFTTFFSYLLTLQFLSSLSSQQLWGWKSLGKVLWTIGSYGRTEGVLRIPRPGLTYAALFAAGCLTVLVAEKRRWRWSLAVGLLGGLMLYVRFDVGSTYLIAVWIFALLASIKDGAFNFHLGATAAVATGMSIPWVYYNVPVDPTVLERILLDVGHRPDLATLPYLACCALAWRYARDNWMLLWLGCMLGASFAACNVQVVLGYRTEVDHWKFFANIFVFLFILCLLAPWVSKRIPRSSWTSRAGLASFLVMAAACLFQGIVYAGLHFPFQALPKDSEDALSWIKSNASADAVVASLTYDTMMLVPAYTGRKTLLALPSPTISDMPLDENFSRLVFLLRALGSDVEGFLARRAPYIEMKKRGERPDFRRNMDQTLYNLYDWSYTVAMWYPVDKSIALLRRSEAQRKEAPRSPEIDYIWIGPLERLELGHGFPASSPLKPMLVFDSPTVSLYRVPS